MKEIFQLRVFKEKKEVVMGIRKRLRIPASVLRVIHQAAKR
jgi:hypothetical protein